MHDPRERDKKCATTLFKYEIIFQWRTDRYALIVASVGTRPVSNRKGGGRMKRIAVFAAAVMRPIAEAAIRATLGKRK